MSRVRVPSPAVRIGNTSGSRGSRRNASRPTCVPHLCSGRRIRVALLRVCSTTRCARVPGPTDFARGKVRVPSPAVRIGNTRGSRGSRRNASRPTCAGDRTTCVRSGRRPAPPFLLCLARPALARSGMGRCRNSPSPPTRVTENPARLRTAHCLNTSWDARMKCRSRAATRVAAGAWSPPVGPGASAHASSVATQP